jgi:subtilisin family serine protease
MNKRIFISLIAFFLITGCTADIDYESNDSGSASEKIVNTKSSTADQNALLIKLTSPLNDDIQCKLESLGVKSISPVFTSFKGKEEMEIKYGLDLWYKVTISDHDIEKLASDLSLIDEISTVEYNNKAAKASDCIVYPYDGNPITSLATKSTTTFDDPYLSDQWNLKNLGNASIATTAYKGGDVNVYDVWNSLTTGDPSIVVAIVDEGVKYNHPDLQGNMWVNSKEYNGKKGVDDDGNGFVDDIYGYNFVSNGDITWSKTGDSGHGTHCAGIVSAVNNNGVGISSVAGGSGNNDGVRIMSCQVFDGNEGGDSYTIAKAIKYAADMGASIISCSFGYKGGAYLSDGSYKSANGVEMDAIDYFEATKNNSVIDGGIAVFASGNDGDPYATYPGAMSDIISVSAFGPDYLPTYYTNYGPGCNIVAPGGEAYLAPWTTHKALILSTVPCELYDDNYGYMQGTSMACPPCVGNRRAGAFLC